MNFARLHEECFQVLRDPTVEQSIGPWLNDAVLEIAAAYELPALKLQEPATLTVTAGQWLYPLSAATHPQLYTYLKRCYRVTSTAMPQGFALEESLEWLSDTDPEHDDTGGEVQRVALHGDALGVYPRADDTLRLWFYRRPVDMLLDTDEPDGIPEPYHYQVLVPKVVLRAFRIYPDIVSEGFRDNTRALIRWQTMLRTALYGDGVEIGLMPYLTKAQRLHTPRVRGPAYGARLSGSRW